MVETCWCCDSTMKEFHVPFSKAVVNYCLVCTPNFDVKEFIENYQFS